MTRVDCNLVIWIWISVDMATVAVESNVSYHERCGHRTDCLVGWVVAADAVDAAVAAVGPSAVARSAHLLELETIHSIMALEQVLIG